jgi:hypothetical protein
MCALVVDDGNCECQVALGTSEGRKLGEEVASLRRQLDRWRWNFIERIRSRSERVAELRHSPLAAFMNFATKHGVHPLRYSFEDPEEERQTVDGLDRRG